MTYGMDMLELRARENFGSPIARRRELIHGGQEEIGRVRGEGINNHAFEVV